MAENNHDIDAEKKQILVEFRQRLGEKAARSTDTLLLQFLDGRGWNLDAAEAQFIKSCNWRESNGIDLLPCATRQNRLPLLIAVRGYDSIDDGNLEAKPGISRTVIRIGNIMGGDCFHKWDREGHPILIDRTGYHNAKELCRQVPVEAISLYQTACNEFLNRVIMPECTKRAGRPIFRETVIFDCNHLGVRHFHMAALHYLKSVIDVIQDYYPETLNRMYLVNAPAILHPIWKIVKPWLEKRTAEKVFILTHSETPKVLLEYIAPENLPSFLGGTCTCEHAPGGCVPSTIAGNIPPLVPLSEEDCEEVETPYNTSIMQKARIDNSYRYPT